MYTIESLLDLAAKCEKIYKNHLEIDDEIRKVIEDCEYTRYDTHRIAEEAMICADYMDRFRIDSLEFVGPFNNGKIEEFKRGEAVTVKRGSIVYSTHPKVAHEGKISSQKQTIRVHSTSKGYVYDGNVDNGRVTWTGNGGYWFWTDINNIEKQG